MTVALSVLDLAPIGAGQSAAEALAGTTTLARRADALGFRRFWVAEHHNIPSVASTAPETLIAHIAANTERIRVGSGGVMLPNHAPLAVAERFGMLEALHPNRIDLGLGRAPGTDARTALALRSTSPEHFDDQFAQLRGHLGGGYGGMRAVAGAHTERQGRPAPIPTVEQAEQLLPRLTPAERATVDDALARVIVGGAESVHAQLLDLVERTGTDELMLVSQVADAAQRIRGLECVARAFELEPARS